MNQENNNINQENSNVFVDNTSTTNDGSTTKADIIFCGRCGAEMKKDARYCMKCGNLNYAHKDNEFMKQYAINNIDNGNYISGISTAKTNGMGVPEDVVKRPYRSALVANILLLGIPLVLILIIILAFADIGSLILPYLGIVLVFGIIFLYTYSAQRMRIKAGEKWWSVYIPVYSTYVMYKMAFGKGWYFIFGIIPFTAPIAVLILDYNIGKRFGKNGWLTLFFPFVMFPIIGFDKDAEFSPVVKLKADPSMMEVDKKGRTKVEKSYRAKQAVMSVIVIIGFILFLILGSDYIAMAWEFFLEQFEEVKKIILQS